MSTAKLGIEVTGARAGVAELEMLRQALASTGREAERLSVQALAWKKAWSDPLNAKEWSRNQKLAAEGAKLLGNILGTQASALASAITSPAKTSYDQALQKAYAFRDENQRVAISLGKSYSETQKQIMGTSKQLGLMPLRVREYAGSVRQLTGDWQGAMDGMEAAQNRALKTDRTIEEMIPTVATLAQTFGIKNTEDMNRFFGTLDAQSKRAKVSAEVAERSFASMAGMFSAVTSAKPSELTALTTAFMAQAPTAALGESALGETMQLIGAHPDVIEQRMRKAGKLGKGERLRDKTGRVRGDKLLDIIEFLQKDIPRIYQTSDPAEAIARVSRTGEMSATGAATLFGLNVSELRKSAATSATAPATAAEFMKTAAGKRTAADVQKERRDIEFGEKFLGAQDVAVSMGGGATGVALGSASQIFSQGAQTFANAVEIFAKSAGGRAVGAATGAAGATTGAAAGTAATSAATGVATKVIGAIGVPGMAAAALTISGDVPERYRVPASESENTEAIRRRIALEREHLADVRKGGISGMVAETFFGGGEKETTARIAELESELARSAGGGGIDNAGADMIGSAVAKHLAQKTLRTTDAAAQQPIGQGQAL